MVRSAAEERRQNLVAPERPCDAPGLGVRTVGEDRAWPESGWPSDMTEMTSPIRTLVASPAIT